MQQKLYRRCTIIIATLIVALIGGSVYLYINRELWADKKALVLVPMMIGIFVILAIYVWYETNCDKLIIRKMVNNNKIALAYIKSGGYVRVIRDSKLKNHVLWKLELTVYTQDGQTIETSTIEKFAPFQTSIPSGNVYVTYDENKPDHIFIIPNAVIGSYPELQPIVEAYENNKKIKITYLNAYYDQGIVLKTFKETLKEGK